MCIYWYILFQLTEKEDASSNGMNNFGFKGLQSYLPSSRQAETQEQVNLLDRWICFLSCFVTISTIFHLELAHIIHVSWLHFLAF